MDFSPFYDIHSLYRANDGLLTNNDEQDAFYSPDYNFLVNAASLPFYVAEPLGSSTITIPYTDPALNSDATTAGPNDNDHDLAVELPSVATTPAADYGEFLLDNHNYPYTTLSSLESHSYDLQFLPDYSNDVDGPPMLLHDEVQHHPHSSPSNSSSSSINDPDDDDEEDMIDQDGDDADPDWPPVTAQLDPSPAQQEHRDIQASVKCTNCETTNTPLWRRSEAGEPLCNACGLFLKLHGEHRPISLKTNVIKRRRRQPKDMAHNKRRRASSKRKDRNGGGVVKK